jgi:hypothetical protein
MLDNERVDIQPFPRYSITRAGQLWNNKKEALVVPTCNKSGNLIVSIKNNRDNWCSMTIARLMLIAFKPLASHEYCFATVAYIDNNKLNVHLDNLAWSFSTYRPLLIPGINCAQDTFVPVYGHPNYQINAHGTLLDRQGKTIAGSRDINGYLRVKLQCADGSVVGVFIHRLVGLTFLEHPIDTSGFIINHKINNINNNHFDNLEWCNHTHNIDHAYGNHMRSQNVPVLAMNIVTRHIMSYHSLRSCAHRLEIPHGAIWWRLRNERPITAYHGYYIKYSGDVRPWPRSDGVVNDRVVLDVLVKNIVTNEVSRYDSYHQLEKQYGIQQNSIRYQLNRPTPIPYRGLLIKHYDEQAWPEYGDEDLRKFALKTTPQSKPISVHDTKTSESRSYSGTREFCREIGYKAEMYLRNKIRKGEPFKHYEISYL